MRDVLFRTQDTVLSVAIVYVVSSFVLPGMSLISSLSTLVVYSVVSLVVAAKFTQKNWIPRASAVAGFFFVLMPRLLVSTWLSLIVTLGLLWLALFLVPRLRKNKKSQGRQQQRTNKRSSGLPKDFTGILQDWVNKPSGATTGSGTSKDTSLPSRGIASYGDPGAGLSKAKELFGEAKVAAGVLGEKETSRILNHEFRNAKNPVALVNSIQFAGSDNADVDHALISGKKVFLIDSKKYRDGSYMATASDTVTVQSSDGVTRTKRVHMDSALENYRKILPSVAFPKAYVMIHSVGKVIPREIGGVFFGSPVQVVHDLKTEIGVGTENINRDVFNAINSRRK